MKKLLVTLLILKILAAIYLFFVTLAADIGLAIIITLINILDIALVVAVIMNIGEIEELWYSLNRIRHDIRKLNDNTVKVEEAEPHTPSIDRREAARGAWECVKCATVNKAGTDKCEHCGAQYSAWDNPTVNPNSKKKVSRWVK